MNSPERDDPLDHFDKRSSDWNELYARPQFRDRLQLFTSRARQYIPKGDVLDYGCGGGVIACEVANSGYSVTGVDGAQGMITEATALASSRGLTNTQFAHIDPLSWSPEARYQGIVCSSVIEYVEEDEKLLALLAEALEPGGALLISIPTRPSLLGFVEDAILGLRQSSDTNFATRRYRIAEFEAMLNRCELDLCETVHFEFPILGQLGVMCSRLGWLSLMTLVTARKRT